MVGISIDFIVHGTVAAIMIHGTPSLWGTAITIPSIMTTTIHGMHVATTTRHSTIIMAMVDMAMGTAIQDMDCMLVWDM